MSTAVATQSSGAQLAPVAAQEAAFALAQRKANALAQSNLVPQQYRGNVADCMIALNMADRLGADPMMVMQNLYIVHGTPGWSSKFLIATFNQSPEYGSIRYEFKGEEDTGSWSCRAVAREKSTQDQLDGPWVSIAMAKAEGWYGKNGSKWQTMPELMLRYRAATLFIRTTAPEISMGLQTVEELQDVIDVSPNQQGVYEQKPEGISGKLDAFANQAAETPANDADAYTGGAMDAEIIDDDGEVHETQDAAEAAKETDFWGAWTGGEPIKGGDVFSDEIDRQLRLVEDAQSEHALKRIFATQETAIREFDERDQLLLRSSYNKRRKELSKGK